MADLKRIDQIIHSLTQKSQKLFSYVGLLQNPNIKICPNGRCPAKIIGIFREGAKEIRDARQIILETIDGNDQKEVK